MQLLNDHSLERDGDRMMPVMMKIDLTERASTVGATVKSRKVPKLNRWVITDEGPTAGMVWRVRDTNDQHIGAGKLTLTVESVVNILKDKIMFGKITPKEITGNSKAEECTAKQAIQYILKKQDVKDFELGTIDYTDSNPYTFNGDDLFSAIETVTASLEDAYWDINFSKYPFKLNIRRLSEDGWSEMRMNRNITGIINKSQSKNNMYTVFYPIGRNNLKLPGDGCLTKNTGTYGRIEKTEADQSMDTVAKLRAWAREKLRNHAKPLATITIPGRYMAEATGEKLDRIRINRICRVPIDGESTIEERVIRISWNDWVKDPEGITVTLCNQENDVASIIKEIQKRGGGGKGGRDDAENAEEDHAWFEDTTSHVAMVAEAIIGKNEEGVDWKRVAEIIVDGEGIHQKVSAMEGDVEKYGTRLDQNEKAIGLVVGTYDDGGNFIKAGGITAAINDDGSADVFIEARKIHALGEFIANRITAEYISSKIANIATLSVKAIAMSGGLSASGDIRTSGTIGGYDLFCRGQDMREAIISASVSGNTLKLKNCKGEETTFSKATSLSGEWSGNTWTVTASPQGNTISVIPVVHPVSSQGGDYTDIYVATASGSGFTNHGNATRLTLRRNGNYVQLVTATGAVLAQISVA